jgi:hypothetical protein
MLALGKVVISLHSDVRLRLWDSVVAASSKAKPTDNVPEAFMGEVRVSLARGVAPTCMLHPDGFVNKIAVGTSRGSVVLVDVKTGATEKEHFIGGLAPIGSSSAVTALAQVSSLLIHATAIINLGVQSEQMNVIGVGLSNGRVVVYDLGSARVISSFTHSLDDNRISVPSTPALDSRSDRAGSDDEHDDDHNDDDTAAPALTPPDAGPAVAANRVTGLAFSRDNLLAAPTLVSVTEAGSMALWNLKDKTMQVGGLAVTYCLSSITSIYRLSCRQLTKAEFCLCLSCLGSRVF